MVAPNNWSEENRQWNREHSVPGTIVSDHKSLSESYAELCMRMRGIQREMDAGTAMCAWCRKPKSEHLHDMRCTTYATSQYFTCVRSDELTKVQKALSLIEDLRSLTCGG